MDPNALPDPLDARNNGFPVHFSSAVPRNQMWFLTRDAIYSLAANEPPRPGSIACLYNIAAPPAVYGSDEERAQTATEAHMRYHDYLRRHYFAEAARLDDPSHRGIPREWWKERS